MQTAGYLAWFMPIQFTSGFVAATAEAALLRSGVPSPLSDFLERFQSALY